MTFDQRRFLFITGKGGVGKTTVSAALAVALAGRGKKVLIALSEAKERLSILFGVPPIGGEITRVAPGISAVRIVPEHALREYGQMILKSRTVTRAVFDNRYVKNFFGGIPGLNEWSVLGKAWYHSTERLPDGNPRFDVVILDAPATGHGVDMLRVPKIVVDIVPAGVLRTDAERALGMFRDPKQSGVLVVTLAEEMPTNETLELTSTLRGELALPIAAVVVNSVMPELFDEQQRQRLLAHRELDASDTGHQMVAAAMRRAIREQVQAASLGRLRALDAPEIRLPFLFRDAASPEGIGELAQYFGQH